jgi:hypothetical protein
MVVKARGVYGGRGGSRVPLSRGTAPACDDKCGEIDATVDPFQPEMLKGENDHPTCSNLYFTRAYATVALVHKSLLERLA